MNNEFELKQKAVFNCSAACWTLIKHHKFLLIPAEKSTSCSYIKLVFQTCKCWCTVDWFLFGISFIYGSKLVTKHVVAPVEITWTSFIRMLGSSNGLALDQSQSQSLLYISVCFILITEPKLMACSNGVVVSSLLSQQEGCGFDSGPGHVTPVSQWVLSRFSSLLLQYWNIHVWQMWTFKVCVFYVASLSCLWCSLE